MASSWRLWRRWQGSPRAARRAALSRFSTCVPTAVGTGQANQPNDGSVGYFGALSEIVAGEGGWGLMLAEKLQHLAVPDLWLLPMGSMPGFWYGGELAMGDKRCQQPHESRWREQIGFADEHECRNP